MIWICAVGWLAGFAASLGVMAAIGERSESTTDGSMTGGGALELLCAAIWPLFWTGYITYRLARR